MGLNLELERLEKIQSDHEGALLAIPGVRGVGISQEGEQPFFIVLVNEQTVAREKIPSTLEGIPVRLVHVQEIVAHEIPGPEGFKSA